MIFYAWSSEIPEEHSADLAALVDEAVEYDAEAGFSTVDLSRPAAEGSTLHHLIVSMPPKGSRGSPDLDRLPDVGVVAYLRLELSDDVGETSFVVRPAFRSLGVATLMMERLLAEPEGWSAVEGLRQLRAWSHGAHPAAERMSWRFEATVGQEIFKTLRLVGGTHPYEAAVSDVTRSPAHGLGELTRGHGVGLAPADRASRDRVDVRLDLDGQAVFVGRGVEGEPEAPAVLEPQWRDEPDKDVVRAVLDAGLLEAQSTGARIVSLYVNVEDELVLHVSREAEFFHDQTDRLYELSLPS